MICPYFLHFNRFCFNYAILFATAVSIWNEKGQRGTEGHRDIGTEGQRERDKGTLLTHRFWGLTEAL